MTSWLDLLGLVGATIIFTWSTLFARIREIYPTFLKCPLCVGFWVGLAGAALRHENFLNAFLTGAGVSLLAFTTHLVLEKLQGA